MDAKTGVWTIRNNNNRRHVSKSARKDPFGLQNLPLDTAVGPEQHDVFYTNMAPVVELLRAIGVLPIRTLPVDSRATAGNWHGYSYAYYVMKLVPGQRAFEVEMIIEELKKTQITGYSSNSSELFKGGGRTTRSEIHKITNYISIEEELSEECTESIIVPTYKKGDKTECNKYRGISLCQLRTKFYPTSCCKG